MTDSNQVLGNKDKYRVLMTIYFSAAQNELQKCICIQLQRQCLAINPICIKKLKV